MDQQKKGWISLLGIPVALGVFLIIGGLLFGRGKEAETPDLTPEAVQEVQLIEGMCGDSIAYTYDPEAQVLTLSGEGRTWDFAHYWKDEGERGSGQEAPWAEYREQIVRIELEGPIEKIGSAAFAGCTELKSVGWGELQRIGDHAFYNSGMRSVQLPESVVELERYAFADCENLTEAVIPDSIPVLGIGTFVGTPVEAIRIGAGTEIEVISYQVEHNPFFDTSFEGEGLNRQERLVIKGYAGSHAEYFANQYQIPFRTLGYVDGYTVEGQCGDNVYWRLELKPGIMTIYGEGDTWNYGDMDSEYAESDGYVDYFVPWHGYRDGIRTLVIEDGIQMIGMRLFADCRNLKEVDWGNVAHLGVCSFQNTGLQVVELPESVRGIWDYSFSWCEQLEEIVIPASVDEISFPFAGSMQLSKVILEGNPVIYGQWSEEEQNHSGSLFYEREDRLWNEELVIYCKDSADRVKEYAERLGESFEIIGE